MRHTGSFIRRLRLHHADDPVFRRNRCSNEQSHDGGEYDDAKQLQPVGRAGRMPHLGKRSREPESPSRHFAHGLECIEKCDERNGADANEQPCGDASNRE